MTASLSDALINLARPVERPVQIPDSVDPACEREVRAMLSDMVAALEGLAGESGRPAWIDAAGLPVSARALLAGLLGQGEITATIGGQPPTTIRETSLQGIWLVDGPARQGIEISGAPSAIGERGTEPPSPLAIPAADQLPAGAMNVLPVLAEIDHHIGADGPAHEINLTLLPMTPVDLAVLEDVLGTGNIEIWCRGYGSCRIASCRASRVWRIHYFNSDGRMILDMLQVGGVPVAVEATSEDMGDSAERLDDLIAAYFPAEN
jgi:hydrogenase-1 operon protein HyaF